MSNIIYIIIALIMIRPGTSFSMEEKENKLNNNVILIISNKSNHQIKNVTKDEIKNIILKQMFNKYSGISFYMSKDPSVLQFILSKILNMSYYEWEAHWEMLKLNEGITEHQKGNELSIIKKVSKNKLSLGIISNKLRHIAKQKNYILDDIEGLE